MQVMQEAVLLVTYVIFLIKIVSNESKKKLNLVGYFFLLPILCHMEGVLIRFEFRWFGYRMLGAELAKNKEKKETPFKNYEIAHRFNEIIRTNLKWSIMRFFCINTRRNSLFFTKLLFLTER